MMRSSLVVSMVVCVVLASQVARAAPPALEPFKGTDVTVSFPRGWVVQHENGVFVAQQDPKRKDAAGILFAYLPNANNATEDQLLDALAGQVAQDLKVTKREALKGGVGHSLIATGTSEGTKVRLAAFAVLAGDKALVSVVVAKPAEFDRLGGLALATAVMTSLAMNSRPPAAPPAAPPAPPVASQPPAGGKLDIARPSRPLVVADLAGEWTRDDSVVTSYASTSTSSGGYAAVATRERWKIDPKGVIYTKFTGTTGSSRGGMYQVNEKSSAAITVTADGTLTITRKKGDGGSPRYVIRGWAVKPDVTVLVLNGPYWDDAIEERVRTDPSYAPNLNEYWVRVTPKR